MLEHFDSTELADELGMALPFSRVQATTPHGTYLFNIVGISHDSDGGVTLRLAEADK